MVQKKQPSQNVGNMKEIWKLEESVNATTAKSLKIREQTSNLAHTLQGQKFVVNLSTHNIAQIASYFID